jgi:hypothetical protein
MAVRRTRLGHSDARTSMLYSHVVSEDGRRFAARLGDLLAKPETPVIGGRKCVILVSSGAKFEVAGSASD